MKKQIFLVFFTVVFGSYSLFAQGEKYFTRNAVISFTSVTPVEKIKSTNKQVNCILNTKTGDMAFKAVVKSFEFDKQGMYDHFNDTYLESDKYPNATFEGKITTPVNYGENGKSNISFEGKLTIHGKTNPVKHTGIIEVNSGKIVAKSLITIKLADYGISVPNDYIKKISNTVDINIDAVMTPYAR